MPSKASSKSQAARRLALKRVYEPPSKEDGHRILVDRIWPRGLSKDSASIDLWMKEVAPSTELRKWFGHEPEKWPEFQKRYRKELAANAECVSLLLEHARAGKVTILFGAKDEERNQGVVLFELLKKKLRSK